MKKSLIALMLGMTLSVSTVATAQVPSDASLTKFMQLMEMDKAFETGIKASLDVQRQQFESQIAKKPDITPKQIKEVGAVFEKYTRQVVNQALTPQNRQKYNQIFIDAAKKHYTQEEIDAYIKFLSTPVGQSVTKKTNALMPEYLSQVDQLSQQIFADKSLNLDKLGEDMDKELEKILNK